MENTFYAVTAWKTLPLLCKWDTLFWGPYQDILKTIMTQWGAGDPANREQLKKYYVRHYEHVRSKVPAERLLEFESKDGWEPLCKFLGKDVPEGKYPRVNDAKDTVRLHAFLYYYRIVKMLKKPLLGAAAVGIGGVAVWWARK